MAATATRRRRKAHHEEEHENEERWLVSFADMMTLLFCLFMVLFAISSVNVSKFEELQKSLQEAFSGKVLPGGDAVLETGAEDSERQQPEVQSPVSVRAIDATQLAAAEQRDFSSLKQRIDQAVSEGGLQRSVQTTVTERGLVVRLRTDGVFFAPGSAALESSAGPLVKRLAGIVGAEGRHPIVVEGYTDSTPISTAQFPSNWELSGARASSVMRALVAGGVSDTRERSVRGFADRHPVRPNLTAEGRSANRRVEIVLSRLHQRTPTP
jgi:chemotaxis protein MotB